MHNRPKISIVTPSFNQAEYLDDTIRSVLDQGYPNLEYLIIDGGSTDRSVEIIRHYEKQLAFWTSEPDNGQYHAINKGFSRSTGEIMLWLNSDDRLLPGSLLTIAEIFSIYPEIQWLTSSLPVIWNRNGQAIDCMNAGGFCRESFFRGVHLPGGDWYSTYTIQQESTCWRRSLWDLSGATIDDTLHYAGDFELWMRFFRHANLYSVRSLIGGFRKHGNQKTGNGMDLYRDEALSCLKTSGARTYGCIQGYARYLLHSILFSQPRPLRCIPAVFTTLLKRCGIIFPSKTVEWNGKEWEIRTYYTI